MHSVAIIATLAAVTGSAVGQFSTILTGSSVYLTVPVDVDVEITLGNTAASATTTGDSNDSGDGGSPVTETAMTTMTVTCAPAEGNCCPAYAYEWCIPVYQIPTTLLTLSSSGTSWGNSSDWVMCKDVCWNNCDVKDHDYSSHGTCEETASPCYHNHTSHVACEPTWASCEPTWMSCEPTCWTKSSHAATTAVDGAVTGVPVASTPVASTHVAGAPDHVAPTTHGPAPATIVGTASAPQSFGLKESLLALGGITALMMVFA